MHGRSGKEWRWGLLVWNWNILSLRYYSHNICTKNITYSPNIRPGNIPQKFKYSVKFEYFLFQYNGFYSPNIQVQNSSFWNKGKYFTFECWENIICMTGKNMEVGLWLYVSGILSFHILDMDRLDLKCLFFCDNNHL